MTLATAWQDAEFPLKLLDETLWCTLYEETGYLHDGQPAPRPASQLRFCRGACPEQRPRWSRAPGPALALVCEPPHSTGQVWEVTAPPSAVLATFSGGDNPEFRRDTEVVVDTRGLSIETHADRRPMLRTLP